MSRTPIIKKPANLTGATRAAGRWNSARIQIRIPLIPAFNDDDENILRTGAFLKEIRPEKIKLLPYHDMAHVKYRAIGKKDTLPVRPGDMIDRLHRALDLMKRMDLPVYSDQ
jgi:pyruvate-formate lyase-activating enzyme